MPLERQVEPPRTYQRTHRGNVRELPHCSPENILSEAQSVIEIIEERTPEGDESGRDQFPHLDKETSHGICACSLRNAPMQAAAAYTDTRMDDEIQEAQRTLLEQTPETGESQQPRLSEQTSPILIHSSHSNSIMLTEEWSGSSYPLDPSATDSTSSDLFPQSLNNSDILNQNTTNILSGFGDLPQSIANCSLVNDTSILSSSSCVMQEMHVVNSSRELLNSDRSDVARIRSPVEDYESVPIASLLMRARSMPTMPPLSAHALQVANRVVKHARHHKVPNERSLWCPDCHRLPDLPVTGLCGHTRCTKCIQDNGACPCGVQAPQNLLVNTVIQDLIRKMLAKDICKRMSRAIKESKRAPQSSIAVPGGSWYLWRRSPRLTASSEQSDSLPRALMSPQSRMEYARRLLSRGLHYDAVPHLARIAASTESIAYQARNLLAQTISVLSDSGDPRRLTRELYRAVRSQSAATWLKPTDLECILCYHSYTNPVTTPCGHTYCRTCIERSMDYRKSCALCLRSLEDFDLASTRETVFISAALASIGALSPPLPPEPDVIPIFVCTVAYPAIPCPLFIFDPRYWMMIRRVLESGSRKFGMVAYERERTYSDYGTVLEVCDCVHLEDGRSILSTVGVSRFRIIKRDVRDGCDVARIQPLTDISPTEELVMWELRLMATQISYKALVWLNTISQSVRAEIETAFGQLPQFEPQGEWWQSPDGPAWLWWLIAILPLRSEIKILILATKSLLKRMLAVSRTLEAIDQMTIAAATSSECELQDALTNTVEWLERSA